MKHTVMTAEGTLSFEAVKRNGAAMVELTAKAKKFPLPISIVVTPEQAQAAHSGLGFVLVDVELLTNSEEAQEGGIDRAAVALRELQRLLPGGANGVRCHGDACAFGQLECPHKAACGVR